MCKSDHIQNPNDLKPREGWTYKGTQVGRISLELVNDGNGCELYCGKRLTIHSPKREVLADDQKISMTIKRY